jgi:hypothetical protein
MEFDNHAFMRDPINDMSPNQAWLKPPQIGASESQIVKTLYCARKKKWDIIYTLPTDTDRNDMAGSKVNRIIAQNPVLQEWTKDHDSVEQKSVGDNIIHYRGTFSNKKAMMVSSNLNVHDEIDASDQSVITQYENRQQANSETRTWYFSHPSLSGFGVDIYWQQSDKKEWFIACPHCHKDICLASQEYKWEDSIDIVRMVWICRLCKGELSESDIKKGEWMATDGVCRYDPLTGKDKFPGLTVTPDGFQIKEFSGYHISQLMCVWISPKNIIAKKNDPLKDEQYFYNYVLGLPYVGSENKISSEVVLKNVSPVINAQSPRIIIGVDTGMPWYLTCMNTEGVFYHERLKNVGELGTSKDYDPKNRIRELLNKWDRSIVIADQGGELSPLRILQQEYPGRVFLVYYRKDRKSKEVISWGEEEEFGTVRVDRNAMFQLMVEQLRDLNRIRFNGSKEDWQEWAEQFDNVYREIKVAKNSPGKDVATNYGVELIWKRNGPDHYCHTLLYCLVGMDKYAQPLAQIIKKDNFLSGVATGSNTDGTIRAASNLRRFGSFNSNGSVNEDF